MTDASAGNGHGRDLTKEEQQALLYEKILAQDPTIRNDDGEEIGWDLEVVVRQVMVRTLQGRFGSNESEAARHLDCDQRTINRFIAGGDTTLATLSKWIVRLGTRPVSFFESNPYIGPGHQRPPVRIVRDKTYDRFRQQFEPKQQAELLSLMDIVRDSGLYAVAVDTLKLIVKTAKIARRRALLERRPPDPGSPQADTP